MVDRIVGKQVDRKLKEDPLLSFRFPESFQAVLDALKIGEPIVDEVVAMFGDVRYLGTNLVLFERFSDQILPYMDDDGKTSVLDVLRDLYSGKSVPGSNDLILKLFVLISGGLSSPELRQKYAALSSHLLGENPCNSDLRTAVEELIGKDVPDFKFDVG